STLRTPPSTTPFPYTTLFRSELWHRGARIVSHRRSYGRKGTPITLPEHRPKSHEDYGQWPPERLIGWAASFGAHVEEVVRRTLRSEEHTSELQSRGHLVCRLL